MAMMEPRERKREVERRGGNSMRRVITLLILLVILALVIIALVWIANRTTQTIIN
jgi:hypothetical protein